MMTQPKNQSGDLSIWLRGIVAKELKIDPELVSPKLEFSELGLDSMSAVSVVGDIEDRLGIELDASVLWEHPTISQISAYLESEGCTAPSGSLTVQSVPDAALSSDH